MLFEKERKGRRQSIKEKNDAILSWLKNTASIGYFLNSQYFCSVKLNGW